MNQQAPLWGGAKSGPWMGPLIGRVRLLAFIAEAMSCPQWGVEL